MKLAPLGGCQLDPLNRTCRWVRPRLCLLSLNAVAEPSLYLLPYLCQTKLPHLRQLPMCTLPRHASTLVLFCLPPLKRGYAANP